MIGFCRGILFAGGILAAVSAVPALGQDNFDAGKTPAQLYASDCAICHKTPNGMSQAGGIFGLSGFLRQHYTASREAANAIATYVQSVDKGPPPPAKKRGKRSAKGEEKGKAGEARKDESKARERKPEDKPEPKVAPNTEEKPGEAKPAVEKSSGAKASDAKPEAPKAAESQPAPKAEDKPAAKDAAPEKKPD